MRSWLASMRKVSRKKMMIEPGLRSMNEEAAFHYLNKPRDYSSGCPFAPAKTDSDSASSTIFLVYPHIRRIQIFGAFIVRLLRHSVYLQTQKTYQLLESGENYLMQLERAHLHFQPCKRVFSSVCQAPDQKQCSPVTRSDRAALHVDTHIGPLRMECSTKQ
jgi:hypothetical protein